MVITDQVLYRGALHTRLRPGYAQIQHMAMLMGGFLHMLNHVVRFQYIPESCGVGVVSVLEVEVEISCQDEITWYTGISLQQVTDSSKNIPAVSRFL